MANSRADLAEMELDAAEVCFTSIEDAICTFRDQVSQLRVQHAAEGRGRSRERSPQARTGGPRTAVASSSRARARSPSGARQVLQTATKKRAAPREKTPDPKRAQLKSRGSVATGVSSIPGLPQVGGDFVLCRTCRVRPALRAVSTGVCCTSCEDLACGLLSARPNAHGPQCTWGILPKSVWRLTRSHEAIPPPDEW